MVTPRIHLRVFAAILALVIFVAAMGLLFSKKIEAESQEKTVKGSEGGRDLKSLIHDAKFHLISYLNSIR